MVAILIGTLNPIALVNKAKDSRRKNDLNKIKIAFEAYYNDKETYPLKNEISEWNISDNCGKEITKMKSYLRILPCDPNKTPYEIVYVNRNTFKVITNLENKKDNHIPPGWYLDGTYIAYSTRKDQVNYGVSSSNILWYDSTGGVDPSCGLDCLKYSISTGGNENIKNGICNSGGGILCFWGNIWGNNLGVVFPGIDPLPQCYDDGCCNGSGCD